MSKVFSSIFINKWIFRSAKKKDSQKSLKKITLLQLL